MFVPVSGPRGMGEYARSLALATAAARRWPQLQIHFAVSKAAPYAADAPFPTTLLPSSPTFHTPEMVELMGSFQPTLVVFDNAGRTAQLRAAVGLGARVVFVSSRPRQRRKAFRLGWMRMLDEHWIAYPEFIAGGLGAFERWKQRLLGRPCVRFLDAVLPPADAEVAVSMMAKFAVTPGEYVLVVPGGGSDHPGAEDAPKIVAEAARRVAERGFPTVLVGVSTAGVRGAPALRLAPRMPMSQLAELIRGARLVISNGGDTLLQAIACARPCVAVPIAGDQALRIEKCERAGLAVSAKLDAADLSRAALELLSSGASRPVIAGGAARRVGRITIENGMEIAIEAIGRLAQRG